MLLVRLFTLVLAAALALPGFVGASPALLRTAWLAEYEAFAAWYAHDQKWDVENGISLEFKLFPTGKNLVDNMKRSGCVLGGCGGAAAVFGILQKQTYVIGIGADETAANAVYVRADSPLLQLKGKTPAYPELYGNAASMNGKTVLAPAGTSAHQLLYFWLERLGTSDAETIVIDTKPEEALKAFVGGLGDAVVLWAPDTYRADELGLRRLFTGRECGITQPTLIVADRAFADANPTQVTAFMKTYLRAVEAVLSMPREELIPLYQRFMASFSGQPMDAAIAARELDSHWFLSAADHQKAFKNRAEGGLLHFWIEDVLRFHEATGALSRRQIRDLEQTPFVTARFLEEAVAQ